MTDFPIHDAANIFPLDEEHLDDLAADIRRDGQLVDIDLLDGKILDGRRRYLACQRAGVEPRFRNVKVNDPVAYVVSLNLHRRHLTPAQLSLCAARATSLRTKLDAEAKQRQKRKPANSVVENLPPQKSEAGKTRDQIGKMFGVSGKSVDYATKILKEAVPEVVKAVEEGRGDDGDA